MNTNNALEIRFNHTSRFLSSFVNRSERILDLGIENDLSKYLVADGYNITNTRGEDLDLENRPGEKYGSFDVVTAFEILEHLVSPFELLRKLPADKLIVTVPLRLWFAPAYRSKRDPRDQHFHEFEEWQFDWLLNKAGWEIRAREKWVSPSRKPGIRPMLRRITPRYYAVYAERNS
ncbi:MAG: class I SAM-dependent methyltransferase [Bacteroidales bacterium]|nr:class I SAM-dependent methyltransferase [Bacteroidales bacterium]